VPARAAAPRGQMFTRRARRPASVGRARHPRLGHRWWARQRGWARACRWCSRGIQRCRCGLRRPACAGPAGKRSRLLIDPVDSFLAQPEARSVADLIIAAAAGVQASCQRAEHSDQASLHRESGRPSASARVESCGGRLGPIRLKPGRFRPSASARLITPARPACGQWAIEPSRSRKQARSNRIEALNARSPMRPARSGPLQTACCWPGFRCQCSALLR